MPYYKRLIIFSILLILSNSLLAQTEPDITGLWKGTMYNDSTGKFLKYEIAISENKGKLYGYTHTYFIVDDKEFHGVKKAKVKRKDDKIIVEDDGLIANNYPIPPAKGIRQMDVLTLEIKDGLMILSGPFKTNRTKDYLPLTGFIKVERKTNFRQSALVPHLEELGLADNLSFVQQEKAQTLAVAIKNENKTAPPVVKTAEPEKLPIKTAEPAKPNPTIAAANVKKSTTQPVAVNKPAAQKPAPVVSINNEAVKKSTETMATSPAKLPAEQPAVPVVRPVQIAKSAPVVAATNAAADIENRVIETIQSVNYQSDSLVLTLYDNGEVDGDTVSVLMNGELIMPMVGLSTNAVRKTIYTKDLPDTVQIVMYAETLGKFPPNTGLLIVNDGKDRYEIRFSGDLKKNAAIEFRRRE